MRIAQHDGAGRPVLFNLVLFREESLSLSLRRLEDAWYVALEVPCRDRYSLFHVLFWSPRAARDVGSRLREAVRGRRADEGGVQLAGYCHLDGCEVSFSPTVALHVADLLLSYAELATTPKAQLDMAASVLAIVGQSATSGTDAEQCEADHRQALEDRVSDESVELAVRGGRPGTVEVRVGSANRAGEGRRLNVAAGKTGKAAAELSGVQVHVGQDVVLSDAEDAGKRVRLVGRRAKWASSQLGAFVVAADIGMDREPVVAVGGCLTGLDE